MKARTSSLALLLSSAIHAWGAADSANRVAEQAVNAWTRRDAATLEAVAHPELVARCREAEIIRLHRAAQAATGTKLGRVGEPPATPRPPELSSGASSAQVFALLWSLFDEQHPRYPGIYYGHRLLVTETIVAGDLAIVVFET